MIAKKVIESIGTSFYDSAKYIVFEGPDGCGKTTQSQLLASELMKLGIPVKWTYEPTKTGIGAYIRAIISNKEYPPAELYYLDRKRHLDEVVTPLLDNGVWVIQDRSFYTTAAYQSTTDEEIIYHLRESVRKFGSPNICIFMLPENKEEEDENFSRLTERRELEVFETEDFQSKVTKRYKNIYNILRGALDSSFSCNIDDEDYRDIVSNCWDGCRMDNVLRINSIGHVSDISTQILDHVKGDLHPYIPPNF